jgi:hypothetical protein
VSRAEALPFEDVSRFVHATEGRPLLLRDLLRDVEDCHGAAKRTALLALAARAAQLAEEPGLFKAITKVLEVRIEQDDAARREVREDNDGG